MAILKAVVPALLLCTCGTPSFAATQAKAPTIALTATASGQARPGQSAAGQNDDFPSRDIGALLALTLLLTVVGSGRHRRDRVEVLAS